MKDTTEIIVVMDKSGSMDMRRSDAIGGFNSFLADQKKEPGEANLTLVLFDTTYSIPIKGVPIRDVVPLNEDTYRPGGNTALNDALARAIVETGARLAAVPEEARPNKVICVIITDGEENSSVEHTKRQVKEMVEHQESKYDWVFIYLGVGVDAFAEARGLGVHADLVAKSSDGSGCMRSVYGATSDAVSEYRSGGRAGLASSKWKDKVQS